MNATITKITTKHYEFNKFYYPFMSAEAFREIGRSLECFGCGQEINDAICIGFCPDGPNRVFHVECAKKLAKKFDTPIKEGE
ncbi:MAG: hypothetical protein ACTSQ8_19935 [Candidatus Helarchaeota archaeon]